MEHMKTKDAQLILETLARGAPLAYETIEARAALERIHRRQRQE